MAEGGTNFFKKVGESESTDDESETWTTATRKPIQRPRQRRMFNQTEQTKTETMDMSTPANAGQNKFFNYDGASSEIEHPAKKDVEQKNRMYVRQDFLREGDEMEMESSSTKRKMESHNGRTAIRMNKSKRVKPEQQNEYHESVTSNDYSSSEEDDEPLEAYGQRIHETHDISLKITKTLRSPIQKPELGKEQEQETSEEIPQKSTSNEPEQRQKDSTEENTSNVEHAEHVAFQQKGTNNNIQQRKFENGELPVLHCETESLLINMDKKHLSTPRTRSDLHMRYYESVIEQDHRLQMIHNPNFHDSEEIVILDKRVANGNEIIKSHSIAKHLNESAPCTKQSAKMNNDANKYRSRNNQDALLKRMDDMKIGREPYCTTSFQACRESLSVGIKNKISQLKSQHRDGCSSLIWNEPGSSNVIDDVSGDILRHITLLCRDVIGEINTCTTGCTGVQFICDACKFKLISEARELDSFYQCSGSFAENCMLPTFYLQTDGNRSVKKESDLDLMYNSKCKVSFDAKESNISMIVDTAKSRPGFLRLFRIDQFLTWQDIIDDREPSPIVADMLYPGIDRRYEHNSPHGPATSIKYDFAKLEIDKVPYLSCPSWPLIATSWIDRKRPYNWPSKETIQTIVSKGCRIVKKPHELSKEKETEFRFSFSEAERILFEKLAIDQKKCFIAFKALIKYSIYKLENETGDEIKLSSYCLKTIFLWTCESFPIYVWETTDGWSRCLLYMIDLLYCCLKIKNIPGYFIPESNLLDTMKVSGSLLDAIKTLRSHPISHAAEFIDATKCFRGFHSKMYDDTNILFGSQKVGEDNLNEMIYLQRIVAGTNKSRGYRFWKKEAVLRIFANWCKQNSNEIRLALWQCLTDDMTLFDVVYLDIVHGFDVPNGVLLKYVDRGWSADFVCRLGSCYNTFDQGKDRKQVKYSNFFKSLLMMQHALDQDNPTIATISTCISTSMKCNELEIAIRALESGAREILKSNESSCHEDLNQINALLSKSSESDEKPIYSIFSNFLKSDESMGCSESMSQVDCDSVSSICSKSDFVMQLDSSISLDDFDSVAGYKTKKEILEMTDITEDMTFDIRRIRIPFQVFFLYSLYVCYKKVGKEVDLVFRAFFVCVYMNCINLIFESTYAYLNSLLFLEILEQFQISGELFKKLFDSQQSHISGEFENMFDLFLKKLYHSNYNKYMDFKMRAITALADGSKKFDNEGKEIKSLQIRCNICSCSARIDGILQTYLGSLSLDPGDINFLNMLVEEIKRHTESTADEIYYAQVLICNKQTEEAISILNRIIEGEGDYSLSVFICPKSFWKLNFLDDNLRKKLSKSSAEYLVFPTNLYARYLLANAYNSLGEMEQCERNKTEFHILRQRYSLVEAFAPMLSIVYNIFK